jgi:hypothetical protein
MVDRIEIVISEATDIDFLTQIRMDNSLEGDRIGSFAHNGLD